MIDSALTAKDFGVVTGASGPRRLCPATRELAGRYLAGEFGLAMDPADFALDAPTAAMSPTMHCALAVRCLAERAPLRVLRGEKLAGAATLLEATGHKVPLTAFGSISHTTIGFERALTLGCSGLRGMLEDHLAGADLDDRGRDFLQSMRVCLDALGAWVGRYAAELERLAARTDGAQRDNVLAVLQTLRNVPENPPKSFREALQALWLWWDFNRLCGNWSGIGRIDAMLAPYLRADLAAGRITLDEARELVAHFWIKGCEWIGAGGFARSSGDGQFYQNIVLAGVDADGRDVTNELTYLVLDVVEELHISDFPIAVRINSRTPERLLRRIAQTQQRGGGIVAIYNEETILPALERFGYTAAQGRQFANDGCWEIILPGQTAFSYSPFDTLRLLQNAIGLGPDELDVPDPPVFEALYERFERRLAEHLEGFHDKADNSWRGDQPAPLLSLLVEGCIEKARSYCDRGPTYSVVAPHAGGIPDTANSLLVLKALVYDEGRLSLRKFVEILRADWAGQEGLRQEIVRRFRLYGNDEAASDAMIRRVYDSFVSLAERTGDRAGVLRPPGISTFGREIEWRAHRLATAFGRRKGDILATNLGPTPGSDTQGPTAVIRSFCGMDFRKLPNGAPLELKIIPRAVKGERGASARVALMRTFIHLGGVFLHIDVVDSQLLRDAQAHPERYPNLSVRISGWSARFATLDEHWQEMIINRTQQGV